MSKPRWNPTRIKRVLRNDIESSTTPVIVTTDDRNGYFKVLGNPEADHVLAREYVGTSLAQWFGMPTFDFAILDFSGEPQIELKNGNFAKKGPGFITREEKGEVWDGTERMLGRITNPEDITRLVCLDTWVRNTDRYFLLRNGSPHTHIDNVFLSGDSKNGLTLKGSDFTHALFGGSDPQTLIVNAKEEKVYGLFPEFQDFLDWETATRICKKLKTVRPARIKPIVDRIPNEWGIDSPTREAWIKFIVARAHYLSINFTALIKLQPISKQQLLFNFDEE